MKIQIISGKRFRFERPIQRILRNAGAIHRQKNPLSVLILLKRHVIRQITFDAAALIVVAAAAGSQRLLDLFTGLKTLDVKVTHHIPHLIELLDQLTVFAHGFTSFTGSIKSTILK